MRAIIQRVKEARVEVDGQITGEIRKGWLVFLGVAAEDDLRSATYLATKILGLRAFPDEYGKMNQSVVDVDGGVLVVSQFTLLGDCRKGRRPSFADAAGPEHARSLYGHFNEHLKTSGLHVAEGRFQAQMEVYLVNDGPVTFMLDSHKKF